MKRTLIILNSLLTLAISLYTALNYVIGFDIAIKLDNKAVYLNLENIIVLVVSLLIIPICQILIMTKSKSKIGKNAINISNFFVFFILGAYVSLLYAINDSLPSSLYYSLIVETFMLIVNIGLFYYQDYKKDLINLFKFKSISKNIIIMLIAYCISIFVIIATNLLAEYLLPIKEELPANEAILRESAAQGKYLINFLSIVIIAPLYEELVFRFVLIGKLLNKIPKFLQVVVATLVFACLHAMSSDNLYQFAHDLIIYSGFSFVLCYVYVYYKNIWMTTILHMVNNYLAFQNFG